MKTILTLTLLFSLTFLQAQELAKDPVDGCSIFEMPEGDTVYVMKQYYMVFYKSGTERSQSEEEAMEIQKKHLAHLDELGKQGYLSIAGPFGDNSDFRGILIFNVPELEKVKELVDNDPAVQANRLTYEIHPWWGAKGSVLK